MSLISRYVTHFSLCHSFLVMSLISRYVLAAILETSGLGDWVTG
jgi:hypothetical protein